MSMSIGLSGLRATSQSLGVISHNIANVSTAGFKSARAEFAAVYGGGQPGGVEVNNVSQNFERDGDVVNTGRALDLAISGNGFFMTSLNGQTAFTRAGTFNRDADNYIVSGNGMRLQGYMTNEAGQLQQGVIEDLQVDGAGLPAQASTNLAFTANLKADAQTIDPAVTPFDPADAGSYNFSQSIEVFDSLGTRHVLTQYFVKTADNSWQVHRQMDGAAMGAPQTMTFDTAGKLTSATTVNLTHPLAAADPLNITLNLAGSTQYAGEFSVSRNQPDGYTAGELAGLRFESNGDMYAVFTNGQDQLKGKVVMADFANPNGLRQGDNTSWYQSFASGAPVLGEPGTGTLGSLTAGAYEGSNVELTGELVNLMTAQRNYQANSKSISAADKMTQVLFNSF
ncbi:flagellar hook protein FlgE [Oceanimonas sp. GK1]|uniref:flagellar hook protein FlgE n=1 Tax=Oceanimonas sp. (strain GK1 / IBRC-M 10197) TaxID=511062 RepID=UPI000249568D|nr:flagellar hook protein FlgE [Oceanimonas sp. GK1]AEY02556.1 flagellar hook protein FlgE [Oceanimonas sp. GK1]